MTDPCPPPDPNPKKPRKIAPKGTVDCHFHIFGPEKKYIYAKNREYTPPDSLVKDYQKLKNTLGLEKGVVIQASVQGSDNQRVVDAIQELDADHYRGIAVVDSKISDQDLKDLHEKKIRGIRINTVFQGGEGWDGAFDLAGRIEDFGWHTQFFLTAKELENFSERIKGWPTKFVIDHMGHISTSLGVDHPCFQNLLKLLDTGKCWIKLSGAYRNTKQGFPYKDVTPFVQALIQKNPDRLVWGSDWPHTRIQTPMPNDGDLFDLLYEWAPDEKIRNQILVENPKQLYFQ